MKKNLLFACLLGVSLASCDKEAIKEKLQFELKQGTAFTIPAFNYVSDTTITVSVGNIPTNSSKVFQEKGTSPDLIKSVSVKEVKLTAKNPVTETFDFVKNVKLYISADGLSEILLASIDSIPVNSSTVTLKTSGESMLEYIKKDNISLKVSAAAKDSLLQDTEFDTDMIFTIAADLLD